MKERDERRRKRGEGRMSSRRTSKCSPADLLEERPRGSLAHKQRLDARIDLDVGLAQNAAAHLLLGDKLLGVETPELLRKRAQGDIGV